MKRIGIVAAAVLPMVVAAAAPSATAGQRIDRVGFLVAGLLAGFGLTRLTGWLDPAVVGRAAGAAAEPSETSDGADVVDRADPVERPVLFDHAALEDAAPVEPEVPSAPSVEAEPVPAAKAAPAKGKRKKSSKAAARPATPAEPVTAEPVVAASEPAASTTDAEPVEPAGDDVIAVAADVVDAGAETAAATPTDEVDPVDIVGIAARTLASQLAPGTRTASSALSALDAGRAPARTTPVAKASEKVNEKARPTSDQPTAAPARGAAPATAPARGRRVETPVADDGRPGDARPTGDDGRVETTGTAGADAPESSVVELLAKRAASTGAGVWSLAMNGGGGGGGGPASWALAPNAEAARKAAEEAVREALDNAGRAEADPSADASDRGTSPIVGRVPRRDR